MDLLLQLFVNGLINGSHYALLAVGFGLILATTGVVHFAYGPIFTLAAYVAWLAAAALGLPIVVGILAGAVVAAAVGMLSYRFLYLPFERRQSPVLVPLIASLGLFIVLQNMIGIVFGTGSRVIENLDYEIFLIGPVFFTEIHLWQVLSLLGVLALLLPFLRYTDHGKAILAMTDNREMARIIGIDTVKVSLLIFALGSAISALPAGLILMKNGASPTMGFIAVFMAFVAAIVGGVGSIRGAIAGGFAIGMLESVGMWKIPTEWQSSIAFVVLLLVVVLRPQGLFGAARG